jgi:hypothetical protein
VIASVHPAGGLAMASQFFDTVIKTRGRGLSPVMPGRAYKSFPPVRVALLCF